MSKRATRTGDTSGSLLHVERNLGLACKWLLASLSLLLWLVGGDVPLVGTPPLPVLAYALSVIAITIVLLSDIRERVGAGWFLWASNLIDLLFTTYLVGVHTSVSGALLLLFGLVAFKAALTVPGRWAPVVTAALCGPASIGATYWARGSLAFMLDPSFMLRYLVLAAIVLVGAYVGQVLHYRRSRIERLSIALDRQEADLDQKTGVLQRTASDLGARVLELRALQEMSRALSSTLQLEEILQLIVNRVADLSESSHCAVALIQHRNGPLVGAAASGEKHQDFRGLQLSAPSMLALARERRGPVVFHCDPAGGEENAPPELGMVFGASTCLMSPLAARDRLIGALILLDPSPDFQFSEQESQLVDSFSYFAATAIENARLYQETWEKGQELEAVLQGIGDGVLVATPALRLVMVNGVARSMFALPRSGGQGEPLEHLVPGSPLVDLLKSTLQDGQDAIQEVELTRANERPRTYQALASPLVAESGQVQGVVAVLRDVTTQKELDRMKSDFMSVVSHELKTPLHSIKGFVEIILMGKTGEITELQRDFLGTVKQQTDSLQRQIDDLLEYSRLESGQVKLYMEQVALEALAARVVNKLAPMAQESQLSLHSTLPSDFPQVEGDRMRLEQVLTNLVENGLKFTPSGGSVRIDGSDMGDHVELVVSDTGVGVPPTEKERVFERFFQVDSSAERSYRGAGLGLTICKHIIAHHGGLIWVEDNQPGGSRFHFTLPKRLDLAEAPLDFSSLPGDR